MTDLVNLRQVGNAVEFYEAPNSLSPASIIIDVHSAYGAHKMTLPTKEWLPTDISGHLGSYVSWLGGPVDAEEMVTALCNVLKVFVPATWSFDSAQAYTQLTPTSPNIPRKRVALGIVGTSISTNPSAAVSTTFNYITTDNGKGKIVLLDSPLGSGWLAPILPADFDANILALDAEFSDANNAWSGRDDFPPADITKVTFDVNDKLQKMYFGS